MDIEVKINDSFYKKCGNNWKTICSECLNEVTLTAYNYIMESGVGVRDGKTPSGGAPVGVYEDGKTGGTLKAGHQLNLGSSLSKQITNNVEYVPYVINGTSRMKPNNYPLRAFNKLRTNGDMTRVTREVLHKYGIN